MIVWLAGSAEDPHNFGEDSCPAGELSVDRLFPGSAADAARDFLAAARRQLELPRDRPQARETVLLVEDEDQEAVLAEIEAFDAREAAEAGQAGAAREAQPAPGASAVPEVRAVPEAGAAREAGSGEAGERTPSTIAGEVAEKMPPGPELALLLERAVTSGVDLWDQPAVMAGFRRMAAWAQSWELGQAAQIASEVAARDEKIEVNDAGQPAQLPASAAAEVALALAMTQHGATWWTGLGMSLTWRLPATGAALRAGEIDLARARLICEATSSLSEDLARDVEARVGPYPLRWTPGLAARFVGRVGNGFDTPLIYAGVQGAIGSFRP